MNRLFVVCVFVFGLLATAIIPAYAQDGACPSGSYLLTNGLGGSSGVTVCANSPFVTINEDNYPLTDDYPCTQQVFIAGWSYDGWYQPVYIVPDSNIYYGQQLKISFLAHSRGLLYPPTFGLPMPTDLDDTELHVTYYNRYGQQRDKQVIDLSTVTIISTYTDPNYTIYDLNYEVYLTTAYFYDPYDEGAGGYFKFQLFRPADANSGIELHLDTFRHGLTSFRVGGINDSLADYCSIPNANLPVNPPITPSPSPTLVPTWTPNPGATATPTPRTTPIATSVPITTPVPATSTPIVYPTTQGPATPTPWGTSAPIATLQYPTPRWPTPLPTIYSAAVPTQETINTGLDALADDINSAWATPLAQSQEQVSTDIQASSDISSVVSIGEGMMGYIGLPVAYARGIEQIFPNLFPYILWIMGLAVIYLFAATAKFWAGLAKVVFELIRRVWEAIPLN